MIETLTEVICSAMIKMSSVILLLSSYLSISIRNKIHCLSISLSTDYNIIFRSSLKFISSISISMMLYLYSLMRKMKSSRISLFWLWLEKSDIIFFEKKESISLKVLKFLFWISFLIWFNSLLNPIIYIYPPSNLNLLHLSTVRIRDLLLIF